MRVTPDDADVLLNGRFIGAAYEFSTARSALHLASRENELIFRKKGFGEQVVDLRSYSSRNISLQVDLEAEAQSTPGVIIPGSPTSTGGTLPPGTEKEDAAKTEPLPPQPAEKPAASQERSLTSVILTVTPAETAIYIDGKFWGLAPETGKIENLRLRPGKYVIEAFKPGHKVFKREVAIPRGEKFELAVSLQK
jgi:hypothetical protein